MAKLINGNSGPTGGNSGPTGGSSGANSAAGVKTPLIRKHVGA
jgi:hypothetical protein